jgi:hypothetical protein
MMPVTPTPTPTPTPIPENYLVDHDTEPLLDSTGEHLIGS